MSKNLVIAAMAFAVFSAGCGSPAEPNANANSNAYQNAVVNIDNANLPEGLSTEPIKPSANSTPGINVSEPTKIPSDVSPAPGIPSRDDLRKQRTPGATPTPGIPGTLKEAMEKGANSKEKVRTVNESSANTATTGSSGGAIPQQRPRKP